MILLGVWVFAEESVLAQSYPQVQPLEPSLLLRPPTFGEQSLCSYSLAIENDGETTIKITFSVFEGGGLGGREENRPKCCFFFRGKRHDNKILKSQILLSKKFVVIAQAPTIENEWLWILPCLYDMCPAKNILFAFSSG